MIAAVYARKSTDQPGVADDAKSVTRARDGLRRAQGLDRGPGPHLRGRRHLGRRVREAARAPPADDRAQAALMASLRAGGCTSAAAPRSRTPPGSRSKARNLVLQRPQLDGGHRFLVRDRDSKFPLAFDEVFRSAASTVIRTPVKAPRANAYAERWVRTVRTECLDWLLILNQRHLEAVLRVYVHHYNAERPHRGLKLSPPEGPREPLASAVRANVCRRDLLGGLLHEYYQAAA